MSSEKSGYLRLHKWAKKDAFLREEVNENFEALDEKARVLDADMEAAKQTVEGAGAAAELANQAATAANTAAQEAEAKAQAAATAASTAEARVAELSDIETLVQDAVGDIDAGLFTDNTTDTDIDGGGFIGS